MDRWVPKSSRPPQQREQRETLEVVVKGDTLGGLEALIAAVAGIDELPVTIKVIHSGVGPVSKTDLSMALTGSRIVLAFNVDVLPRVDAFTKDHGIEIRLHDVIYDLLEDLRKIARSRIKTPAEETVTGKARVIALFKSSHRGIIVGCEVLEGTFETGRNFRVLSAMGEVYSGRIESLQVDRQPVKRGVPGQQVGVKISDYKKVKIGDLLECFEPPRRRESSAWQPSGAILDLRRHRG